MAYPLFLTHSSSSHIHTHTPSLSTSFTLCPPHPLAPALAPQPYTRFIHLSRFALLYPFLFVLRAPLYMLRHRPLLYFFYFFFFFFLVVRSRWSPYSLLSYILQLHMSRPNVARYSRLVTNRRVV
ncbi:hypothetical protein F5I97DRAFT_1659474 [Phlebopus sp. FC_14]|nr:hypothetical protein F5I97DRAFT_1659474 [Phlebopus sp. FC_14]